MGYGHKEDRTDRKGREDREDRTDRKTKKEGLKFKKDMASLKYGKGREGYNVKAV